MRIRFIGGVLAILVFTVSACGGSGGSSTSDQALEQKADSYDISLIERSFHESISKKNIDELVGLFAPHATGTFGPGKTVTGKDQIRQVWSKSVAFKPSTHWLSDHPAYKLKVTVDGDRGTLHFECHFIDVDTGEIAALTAGNLDLAKIDGKWLITNFTGSTTSLKT
jgi:ketosteroid isomerase-like protein